MGFICIGVQGHFFLRFLNYEGCGEKWESDSPDGRCPICRGYLVPERSRKQGG